MTVPIWLSKPGCDGVHVGPEDMPYQQARDIVGEEATVGVSCKASRHLAMTLADAGADYVAFGAFLPVGNKDRYGNRAHRIAGSLVGDNQCAVRRYRRNNP